MTLNDLEDYLSHFKPFLTKYMGNMLSLYDVLIGQMPTA